MSVGHPGGMEAISPAVADPGTPCRGEIGIPAGCQPGGRRPLMSDGLRSLAGSGESLCVLFPGCIRKADDPALRAVIPSGIEIQHDRYAE